MPTAIFRCDGSSEIGIGHVVRCRALAAAFRRQDWTTTFAMTEASAALFPEDNAVIVPSGTTGAAAVRALMRERGAACLVVDHYGLDEAFERQAAEPGDVIVAIDDLADRPHHCHLLVDTNPARTAADYAPRVPTGAKLLLGARFALLRSEFADLRRASAFPLAQPEHLVIALGGADPSHMSRRALDNVPTLNAAGLKVTLIVGQATPHRDELVARAGAVGAEIFVNPPNAVALMASADIAICGAGTTCLEFACLGVPTVALVLADNQRAVAAAIRDAGATVVVDGDLDFRSTVAALQALVVDTATRARMSAAGQTLVDGQGAARVAADVVRLHAIRKPVQ